MWEYVHGFINAPVCVWACLQLAEKESNETKRKAQVKQTYEDDHKDTLGAVHDNPISGPYSNHHQVPSECNAFVPAMLVYIIEGVFVSSLSCFWLLSGDPCR